MSFSFGGTNAPSASTSSAVGAGSGGFSFGSHPTAWSLAPAPSATSLSFGTGQPLYGGLHAPVQTLEASGYSAPTAAGFPTFGHAPLRKSPREKTKETFGSVDAGTVSASGAPINPASFGAAAPSGVTFGTSASGSAASPPVTESAAAVTVFDPPPPLDDASIERVLSVAEVTRAELDELEEQSWVKWEQHSFKTGKLADGFWTSEEWAARWNSENGAAKIAALGLRELHYLLLAMGVAQSALRKMSSRAEKHRLLESLLPRCRAVVRDHRRLLAHKNTLNPALRAALSEQAEALIRTGRLDAAPEALWRTPFLEFGSASSSSSSSSSSSAVAVRPEGMDGDDWMDLNDVASAVIVRKEGVSVAMLRDVLQSSPWILLDAAGVRARRCRLKELRGNEFHLLTKDEAVIGAHMLAALAGGKPLSIDQLLQLKQSELSGWSKERVLQALRLNTALNASESKLIIPLTPDQQKDRISYFTLIPDCARPLPQPQAAVTSNEVPPSSASGFSVGFAPSSSSVTSGVSLQFGGPTTSARWVCSACLVPNHFDKCYACGMPKSHAAAATFGGMTVPLNSGLSADLGPPEQQSGAAEKSRSFTSPRPLASVCSLRPFSSISMASSTFVPAPLLGERAVYFTPARAADADADPDAAVPVTSSCSFSVRIRQMMPFNRLRIGFRQNSMFAQTHLLQLCFAAEGALQTPGHGELYRLQNARRPRMHNSEPDVEDLWEAEDGGSALGSSPSLCASPPSVVAVDPAVPNASSYRVFTAYGVAWSVLFVPRDGSAQPFRMQLLQRVDDDADAHEFAVTSTGAPALLLVWLPKRGTLGPTEHQLTHEGARFVFMQQFYTLTGTRWDERHNAAPNARASATWIDESDPSIRRFAASQPTASSLEAKATTQPQSSWTHQPVRTVALPPLRIGSVVTCHYDEARAEIRFALNGEEVATISSVLTRHAQPAGWDVSALHAMIPILLVHGAQIEAECVAEEEGRREAEIRSKTEDFDAASALSSLRHMNGASPAVPPPLRDLAAALSAWSAQERAQSSSSSFERDNHTEGLVPCAPSAVPGVLRMLFHDYDISRAIGLPYMPVSLIDLVTEYMQFAAPRTGTRQFGWMRFWALLLRQRRDQHPSFSSPSTVSWMFQDAFPFQTRRGGLRGRISDVMSDTDVDDPNRCVYHDLVCSGLRSRLYSDPNWRAVAREDGWEGFDGGLTLVPTEGTPDGFERMFVRFAQKHPDQLRFEDYSAAERAKEEMVALYGDLEPVASSCSSSSFSDSSLAHAALLDRHFGGGVAVDEDGKWMGKVDFRTPVSGGGFKVGSSLRFAAAVYGEAASASSSKSVPVSLDPSSVTFGSLPRVDHFPLPPIGVSLSDVDTSAEFVDQSCLKQMIRAAASPPSLGAIKSHLVDVCGRPLVDARWPSLCELAQQLIQDKFGPSADADTQTPRR